MRSDKKEKGVPYVRIIEQPTSKGIRFRYECEGRCAGCLVGENATIYNKSYPTIKIENYRGPAFIVVSCISKDPPFYPHPHNLVGKTKEVSNGICYFKTETEDMVVSFAHLGIQCVTRKGIEESLAIRQKLHVDPFNTGYDQNPDSIDLYCVRLCFQVFLEGHVKGNFDVALDPVISDQIHDKRMRVEPVINFMSHMSASADGGTEICILCEKAIKDDIEVRFYRKENKWEAIAELTSPKVFKQVAVVFICPKYVDLDIARPVEVGVQLRRISDGETSETIPFLMTPPSETHIRTQKSAKRKRSSGLTIADQIQAEASKNTDLLNLAYPKSRGADKSEAWELPAAKKKSTIPADKSRPFIPVITLRSNEFNEIRNRPLRPTMLNKVCSKNIIRSNKPFDYSMKSLSLQKSQTSAMNKPAQSHKPPKNQHSFEIINTDNWMKDFIDTIDPKCSSSPSLQTAPKTTDRIASEPVTKFVYAENMAIDDENFGAEEMDNLLGLEKEADENINDLAAISGSLSSINISDLIKDIGNGIAATNMDNILGSIDNLPPAREGVAERSAAQNTDEPLEIPIEALKAPYLLT